MIRTGSQYIDSIRDGREVYLNGERVKDVTLHPMFKPLVDIRARIYDMQHEEATRQVMTYCQGGETFAVPNKPPVSQQDWRDKRAAVDAVLNEIGGVVTRVGDETIGEMWSLMDGQEMLKAADPRFADNVQRHIDRALYEDPFHVSANTDPKGDRSKAPQDQDPDMLLHLVKETSAGVIVRGAKYETAAAYANQAFTKPTIANWGNAAYSDYALGFIADMGAPNMKFICRTGFASRAPADDYPLANRFDEVDALIIFDDVLIPWENVFQYGDVDKSNMFMRRSGFGQRLTLQGATRLAVKLDFISGLLLKALSLTGTSEFRGVQTRLGEVLSYRELIWSLTEAMIRHPEPWLGGSVQPEPQACDSYRWISTVIYPKVREIIFQDLGSALIYLPSHVKDFDVPELRGYLDKYVRGSGGVEAEERVKTLKMLWDAVGTEFGGRHELYERNYQGNHEQIRVSIFGAGEGRGWNKQLVAFAEQAMSEYDREGWTLPELQ